MRLQEMHPEDVARRLGGRKSGKDWIIPDVCKGKTTIGSGALHIWQSSDGRLAWHCFSCQNHEQTKQALLDALNMVVEYA